MDYIYSTQREYKCSECGEQKNPVALVTHDFDDEPVYLCTQCVEEVLRCLEALR